MEVGQFQITPATRTRTIKYGPSGLGIANVVNVRLYYVATCLEDGASQVYIPDGCRIAVGQDHVKVMQDAPQPAMAHRDSSFHAAYRCGGNKSGSGGG
jgi:hypothetical protein